MYNTEWAYSKVEDSGIGWLVCDLWFAMFKLWNTRQDDCWIWLASKELALARGFSPEQAKEQGAMAVLQCSEVTGLLADRQASMKHKVAAREEVAQKTLQLKAEYEEEKAKQDELRLEKIDLELELEADRRKEQKSLAEKPAVARNWTNVDLACLKAELTVQKELAEQEMAQCSLDANSFFLCFSRP